jgi:DNA-binding MarR family transcriptional regulator
MSTAERTGRTGAGAGGVGATDVSAGDVSATVDRVAGDCTEAEPCSEPRGADSPDLTWLLHRAAQRMRTALDEAAQAHGLTGARDWIVLSALRAGPRQTQLALANALGLDKTTMTSLLDRMEARGLITRRLDRSDRRARIPELTEAGRETQAEVTRARDRVEAGLLSTFTGEEQRRLRELLGRLAAAAPTDHGSCM